MVCSKSALSLVGSDAWPVLLSQTNACSRHSRLSHLVLAHKLRQTRLQLNLTLGCREEEQ